MERRLERPRERPRLRAAAALAVSLAVNAAGLAGLGGAGAFTAGAPPRPTPVALARLSGADWEARRRIAGAPPVPAAPDFPPAAAPPERPPAPDPQGTVVRVAPAPDPRRPAHARFLAERDGSVERETRWRGPRPPDPVVALAPRPLPGAPGAGGADAGAEGTAEEDAPGRGGAPDAGAAGRLAAARRILAAGAGDELAIDPAAIVGRAPGGAGGDGGGGGARRGRYDPRLLPLADGPAAAGGGAPSGDPLPGVADGDATLVNTRGFRFAGFYRRVHDAIAGEWKPNRVWDARDPHDRVLGRARRQVEVDIVLDAEGRLRELRLVRGSGLAFFDAECLRAVRDAAPFPNPPRGLLGADGAVALRGWRLVFDFGPEAVLDRWLPGR